MSRCSSNGQPLGDTKASVGKEFDIAYGLLSAPWRLSIADLWPNLIEGDAVALEFLAELWIGEVQEGISGMVPIGRLVNTPCHCVIRPNRVGVVASRASVVTHDQVLDQNSWFEAGADFRERFQ